VAGEPLGGTGVRHRGRAQCGGKGGRDPIMPRCAVQCSAAQRRRGWLTALGPGCAPVAAPPWSWSCHCCTWMVVGCCRQCVMCDGGWRRGGGAAQGLTPPASLVEGRAEQGSQPTMVRLRQAHGCACAPHNGNGRRQLLTPLSSVTMRKNGNLNNFKFSGKCKTILVFKMSARLIRK